MCKRLNPEETCKLAESLSVLDGRVTNLESEVKEIKANQTSGFSQMQTAIASLGHDFGERMNIIEKKVVDEKTAWGECFRRWLDWIVKLLILGCGAAMGMTAYKMIFGN